MIVDPIVIDIFYPHPVSKVWKALIDSKSLAVWLMPNDFQPTVGHRFTFQPSAQQGWSGMIECEVTAIDPEKRVSYRWYNEPSHLDTLVTFTLDAAEGGTNLRLEHSGFESAGQAGKTIRDMLGMGWNSRILRERLPALLDAQTN